MATVPKSPTPERKPPTPISGHSSNAVSVTADNFVRAESDMYAAAISKDAGGVGKLIHRREPAAIDNQTVPRFGMAHGSFPGRIP